MSRPLPILAWVEPPWYQHLNEVKHHKLTFVKAPSGVGKTMSISHWVKNQPHSWIALHWESNDFPVFFRQFMMAWKDAPAELRSMCEWHHLPPVYEVSKLVRLALVNTHAQIFVFDRIDVLNHPTICDFLNQILQGLPNQIHIVFSGTYLPGQISLKALKEANTYFEIQPDTEPYAPLHWPKPLIDLVKAMAYVETANRDLGQTLHAELWKSAMACLNELLGIQEIEAIEAPKSWLIQFNKDIENEMISLGCEALVSQGEFSRALGVSVRNKLNVMGVLRQGISQHVLQGYLGSSIKWFESLPQDELFACSDLCVSYAEALVREEKYMPAFTWMKRCELAHHFKLKPQDMSQWLNLEANLAFVQGEYQDVIRKSTEATTFPLSEYMVATSAYNQGIGHFFMGDLSLSKTAFQSCLDAFKTYSDVYTAQDTQFLVAYIQLLSGEIKAAEKSLDRLQEELVHLNLKHEVAFKSLLFTQWIKNLNGEDTDPDDLIVSTQATQTYPLDLSLLCELLWRTGHIDLIKHVLPENVTPPLMTWHIILEGDSNYFEEFTFYQDWHWKSIFDAFGLFRAAHIFKMPQKVKPLIDYLLAFSIKHQGYYMCHELLTWQSLLGLEYDKNLLTKVQNKTLLPTFLNQSKDDDREISFPRE